MLLTTLRLKCTPQYQPATESQENRTPRGHLLAGKTLELAGNPEGTGLVPWASLPWAFWLSCSLGGESGEAAATCAHCFPDALRKKALLSDSGIGNSFPLPLLTDATPGIFNGNIHTHVSLQGLGASQHALGCE